MIAFVGGGGKTSAMFRLADESAVAGRTVLVTTTTAIFHPDREGRTYRRLVIGSMDECLQRGDESPAGVMVAAAAFDSLTGKLYGYPVPEIERLAASGLFDVVLIEADGAKGLPVKAPAGHEPVIPQVTGLVVGLIGLDCLGRPLNRDTVHRPERFIDVTGGDWETPITQSVVTRLVMAPQGLFKNAPAGCRRVVLLNKADTPDRVEGGRQIGRMLRTAEPSIARPEKTLIGSVKHPDCVKAVIDAGQGPGFIR